MIAPGWVGITLSALLLASCGGFDPVSTASGNSTTAVPPTPARSGTAAASQRITFVPQSLTLPSGDLVRISPAVTTKGSLEVPEAADSAGWWDGSARAGDAFGSTVIAGHVDTGAAGLASFAQLLRAKVGDVITVAGDGHELSYRVGKVGTVDKDVLATSSDALSQVGDHRLSLITCTGTWDPVTRHYDSNLVVTAVPMGPAAPTRSG